MNFVQFNDENINQNEHLSVLLTALIEMGLNMLKINFKVSILN